MSLSDCAFDGQGDDALNVHGRYHIIDSVSENRKCVGIRSKWGSVSDSPRAGDGVWAVNSEMRRLSKRNVRRTEILGDTLAVLHLSSALPKEITPGMCIENASRFPEVCVERCYFGGGNRARGILLTSPGKTIVRDNIFRSNGAAILIEGDTDYWYESGAVRDVDIRDNEFDGCAVSARGCSGLSDWGPAPISITPSIRPETKTLYHRGIKIRNNVFRLSAPAVLYARGVDGLKFQNNIIIPPSASSMAPTKQPTPIFIENCRKVSMKK